MYEFVFGQEFDSPHLHQEKEVILLSVKLPLFQLYLLIASYIDEQLYSAYAECYCALHS